MIFILFSSFLAWCFSQYSQFLSDLYLTHKEFKFAKNSHVLFWRNHYLLFSFILWIYRKNWTNNTITFPVTISKVYWISISKLILVERIFLKISQQDIIIISIELPYLCKTFHIDRCILKLNKKGFYLRHTQWLWNRNQISSGFAITIGIRSSSYLLVEMKDYVLNTGQMSI